MSASKLTISAIICTRNRADYLRDALHSLLIQNCSSEVYEVIIVDNASSDNSAEVVNSLIQQSNIHILYVHEARLGLSYARNRGAEVAQGDILAYIDDDAIAAVNWIKGISSAFSLIPSKQVGIVGGKVELLWEAGKRPAWLSRELDGYLAGTTYRFDSYTPLAFDEYPVGANLSITRDCFREVGGFSTSLGRQGNNLLSNEEVLFCDQARRIGYQIWYAPEVVVQHRVPPKRSTRHYMLARTYWQGVSDATMLSDDLNAEHDPFWRSALGFARDMLRYGSKMVGFAITGREADAFVQACYASSRLGCFQHQMNMRVRAR